MAVKTIQELLNMKEEIKNKKEELHTMHLNCIDSDVTFKIATYPEMVSVQEMNKVDIDPYLILTHVVEPNFKDSQLQETFNSGEEPHKIIYKIIDDIEEMGKLSLAIIGRNKKDAVKEIKNL